jgi:hypothetical protein
MPAPDLEIAQQFRSAAEEALRTGHFEPLVALLAPDVECATPQHVVQGVDAVTDELSRARPAETLDVEFENGDWKSLGPGRFACEVHVLYRSKASGEVSFGRDRSFELTIRDGKVGRYAMRFAG